MSTNDTVLAVAVACIRDDLKGIVPLAERFRKACQRAREESWIAVDNTAQLKAAMVATDLETEDADQKRRFELSCQYFWRLNAALNGLQAGVAVDFKDTFEGLPDLEDPLPIMKIWNGSAG